MPGTNDSVFSIQNIINSDGKVDATVVVNENSEILKGHFPSQPVVPGACMLQLVKDVLERAVERRLQLKKANNIKFMNMIVPKDEGELRLDISYKITEDNSFAVQVNLLKGDLVCFKFQGILV